MVPATRSRAKARGCIQPGARRTAAWLVLDEVTVVALVEVDSAGIEQLAVQEVIDVAASTEVVAVPIPDGSPVPAASC